MNKLKLLIALIILFIVVIYNFYNLAYISKLFYDEIKILSKSKDVDYFIDNNLVNAQIKEQLILVPEAMDFGDKIGFPKTEAYSTYSPLDRDVYLYSLSASKKDRFEDYRWSWLFVGMLPYKGFTNKNDALKEENALKDLGYDTTHGKSSAMSTLGIFNDPIITTMINENDSTRMIEIIYHERTHQLFFKKNYIEFNENSAQLIGMLATLEFLKQKYGEDSIEYQTQLSYMNDSILFSSFINEFYSELNLLYSQNISKDDKLQKRKLIFEEYSQKYKDLKPHLIKGFKKFDQEEINNALILSYYRYYGRLPVYLKVHQKLENNLSKTIEFFDNISRKNINPDLVIKEFIIK